MRSARMILATAAASAVLAIGAPGAYAAGGDWDHDDSSHSDGSSHGKEHGQETKHDSPHGGMHTGGGALTAVNDRDDWATAKDPKTDPETYKDKDGEHGQDSWGGDHDSDGGRGNDSWSGGHEKPSGGMHTGGGGLATPSATAGGLAALAVAATGLYAVRRKKPAGSPA
ncbi:MULTISPECIES: hypothetical protein [unclassified Streptomyces]|uniref:hypothetical protein n=1 Tax=unclassified Streptomyces TaxID=2593676 RepID=UPI00225A8121|nr:MULTISPECIES: hypothetical protein [unclassified Streptomyces]MCX4878982.1 hypothetical protein [Streptomyces sp. NBC_00847]MCX5418938.1 hypothetical protein [Streptomyces sp. NBC_00078]